MAVKAFDVFVLISVCIYSRNIWRIYLGITFPTYLFLKWQCWFYSRVAQATCLGSTFDMMINWLFSKTKPTPCRLGLGTLKTVKCILMTGMQWSSLWQLCLQSDRWLSMIPYGPYLIRYWRKAQYHMGQAWLVPEDVAWLLKELRFWNASRNVKPSFVFNNLAATYK